MTNYWIFTVKDQKNRTEKKKGIEIFKQRMIDRFWGLSATASNKSYLKPNDKVVFYCSGKEGQKFLGTSILDSEHYKLTNVDKRKFSHGSFFQSDYGVKLKQIRIWKSAKSIRPLLTKLEIIKNPKKWGIYLHGSIKRISNDDYNIIIESNEINNDNLKENVKQQMLNKTESKGIANLEQGQELSHNEICQIFKCSSRGGMRRSHLTNTLLLISDHTDTVKLFVMRLR